jgi:non-specific protein-tyrosine kinase
MINKIKAVNNSMMIRIREVVTLLTRKRSNGNQEIPVTPTQNIFEEQNKEKPGWVSPNYSQSRAVHLDPGFIARNRCLLYLDNSRAAESFRVLRTQLLQRTRDSGANTIMVTSTLPGEGKTLTAINLAVAISREFQHTVMLVDGDLRKQSVHKYLGCTGEKGLIDYLAGSTPVSDLITWPGIEKMTFISGGRLINDSAEILGSPRMRELIPSMKGRYPERYIIFDAPPILTGADVLTLAPLVDKVIVVVQAGKTSMDDVQKALQYLPKEKVLGLVLNRSSSTRTAYYYDTKKQR